MPTGYPGSGIPETCPSQPVKKQLLCCNRNREGFATNSSTSSTLSSSLVPQGSFGQTASGLRLLCANGAGVRYLPVTFGSACGVVDGRYYWLSSRRNTDVMSNAATRRVANSRGSYARSPESRLRVTLAQCASGITYVSINMLSAINPKATHMHTYRNLTIAFYAVSPPIKWQTMEWIPTEHSARI